MAYDTKNNNRDIQAEIEAAAKAGDYKKAAQLEQERNEKIDYLDSTGTNQWNAEKSSNYAGWLDNTDYGIVGKQQMESGANWEEVLDTYNNRYNKAAGTVGLTQYANDDIQKEMWDYITTNMQNAAGYSMPTYSYDVEQPTFTSNYQSRIDEMLNQILNRDSFSYNAEADPLYQQYKTQYNREGERAMNDTLAAAASGAGGMNSYAITAAQQANNYYATQLNDKIPELYQLAYDMYLSDIDQQVRDLGLLQDMDDTQYSRYRDTMSDWRDDRDFAYGMYRDDMGDYQWGQNFEYNAEQDAIRNDISYGQLTGTIPSTGESTLAGKEFEYGKDEDAFNKALDILNSGAPLTKEQLEASGLSEEQAQAILNIVTAYNNKALYDNADGKQPDVSDDTVPIYTPTGTTGTGYDNGGLTPSEVAEMQRYFGVTADGMWGPASRASVDGLNADEAWQRYEEETGGTGGNGGGYNNGSLSPSQIKELQDYYGVEADGKWGKNSSAAANGWSADEAWESYQMAKDMPDIQGKDYIEYESAASNYKEVDELLAKMKKNGATSSEILAALKEARDTGALNNSDYGILRNRYC